MQYLEDDMDDLFRRAGENYSPQKGKGDWESIAKKISAKPDSSEIGSSFFRNRINKKTISLISLLSVFLCVCWLMFQIYNNKFSSIHNTAEKLKIRNFNTIDTFKKGGFNILKEKDISYNEGVITATGNISGKETNRTGKALHFKNNTETSRENIYESEDVSKNEITYNNYFSPVPNFKKYSEEKFEEILKHNNKVILKEKNLLKEINSLIPKTKPAILQKNKGVYIGFMAGADFSKVQSVPFNNTGFDEGAVLGYRANRKLSFESGIIWNKKNYRSRGKNFNTTKVSSAMPSGMIINNLESKSSLIEIPIKVKYDLIDIRNADFFLAGGISCYIMTKEKNVYNVILNGDSEKISGIYEKNNYKMPAVANVSIGYEHSVSTNIHVRVEPFFKIPLQGIGIGSLPVTSVGLQIGVTSRLK